MANKKIFWGMLCITLTFVFVLSGCDDGSDDPDPLNGTWVSDTGGYRHTLILNNGSFESWQGTPGVIQSSGTYTTNGNTLTVITTHAESNGTLVALPERATESFTFTLSGNNLIITSTYEGDTYTSTYTR